MLLKIAIIAVIIYLIVITQSRVRVPHPGVQAAVDVMQAATLTDSRVTEMARRYIAYSDQQYALLPIDDPYAERLERLTANFVAVNDVPLNFRAYPTPQVNAFATADGSIRVFTGLMDRMNDSELMAIIGHEMGHVRNSDTLQAMRKALLSSAVRNALGASGGALGSLSGSTWGALAEKLVGARFSQEQEFAADDFSLGFLQRNGYDPHAMADALDKICILSRREGEEGDSVMQLFSTHPASAERATRTRQKADAMVRQLTA